MEHKLEPVVKDYVSFTARIVFRALDRAGRFRDYERHLGPIESEVRWRISIEVARYLWGSFVEASRSEGSLKASIRRVCHKLKVCGNRLKKRGVRYTDDAGYVAAWRELGILKAELELSRRGRGRERLASAEDFITNMAYVYDICTQSRARISYDEGEYGPFVDLLNSMTPTIHALADKLFKKPEDAEGRCFPDACSRLSANLPRLARKMRLNDRPRKNLAY